jgi:hypothetical protein
MGEKAYYMYTMGKHVIVREDARARTSTGKREKKANKVIWL